MTQKCTLCGEQYELALGSLPECPECIRRRMPSPGGVKFKHTFSGAVQSNSFSSYKAAGFDGDKVFDYMAYGPHTSPSGCEVFYSKRHDSFNAVSHKPLGEIPGSGIQAGHHFASEFAILADLQGEPHWMFETQKDLQQRIDNDEYVSSKCAACGAVTVYTEGSKCLNCQQQGNS
jgi:predicted RNA-binding Zn-ribbon protein involved in translation (DUF1610 family)